MRTTLRSHERPQDEIRRANFTRQQRSRERERDYKKETRERPRAESEERATIRSVSIRRESNRGTTRDIRRELESNPRRQHVSRCGRCHNFDGTVPINTHNYKNPCYALRETCTYCQKPGHITDACRHRVRERREDKELGSLPCFACENPNQKLPTRRAREQEPRRLAGRIAHLQKVQREI